MIESQRPQQSRSGLARISARLGSPRALLVQLVCLLTIFGARAAASANYENTDKSIVVSNDRLRFVISKENGAFASLRLDGHELIGHGGSGYFDLDDSVFHHFVLGHHDKESTRYSVKKRKDGTGSEFVEITVERPGNLVEPVGISQHYLLRDGETGIHLFTILSHAPSSPEDTLYQARFVLKGDPAIFDHVSVEEDGMARPWRTPQASILPTAEEQRRASVVQDATLDLSGTKSAYPRRVYTKYDWSVFFKDHLVHGYYGHGYGAWICQAHNDAMNGGPMKQDLTVHAGAQPVLLNMIQATHYGAKPVRVAAGWQKTYGPFFLYLNEGVAPINLRADALKHADTDFDESFYESLNIPGYVPSSARRTVTGHMQAQSALSDAVAVLSDNNTEFWKTAQGYQYWTDIVADGSFRLSGVRPGTYRLTLYSPGVFGDYHLDNVTIAEADLKLPPMKIAAEPTTTLWQIGIPDRTAAEFRHGDEFRNYWGTFDFDSDFPEGVHFVIGQSDARKDWNYVQWKRFKGREEPDWTVQFGLTKEPPRDAKVILTVALAGQQCHHNGHLVIFLNGEDHAVDWQLSPEDSSSIALRSGVAGTYALQSFVIDRRWLKKGNNTMAFRLAGDQQNVLYDAIRLAVEGSAEVRQWAQEQAVLLAGPDAAETKRRTDVDPKSHSSQ